jgi:hypothetical protein
MAISGYDILSLGLYSGPVNELTNSDKEEAVYEISLGLIKTTQTTTGVAKSTGGLNDVGTSIRL